MSLFWDLISYPTICKKHFICKQETFFHSFHTVNSVNTVNYFLHATQCKTYIARKHKAWDANKDYVLALSFYFIFLISSNLKRKSLQGGPYFCECNYQSISSCTVLLVICRFLPWTGHCYPLLLYFLLLVGQFFSSSWCFSSLPSLTKLSNITLYLIIGSSAAQTD